MMMMMMVVVVVVVMMMTDAKLHNHRNYDCEVTVIGQAAEALGRAPHFHAAVTSHRAVT
jgi:uncharacterized membrane protein